ncbi:MAG: flagellar export protein FliJ [Clostridiales bacterium]|jgi:flagellar FliJ protein|nr:flagellar export protein FliJ [Clostridiales bacterium]
MAGFKFRMESFLGVKEKIEEQKKLDYGKALKKLDEEQKLLELFINKKMSIILAMRNSINSGIKSAELRRYNEYISYIKNKIEEQEIVVKNAEDFAEDKRVELVEAMKERKMLDVLKENDKAEYNKEQLLKEQKIVDEIVSYQYNNA